MNILPVLAYLVSTIWIVRQYPRYLPLFGLLSLMQLWALASCFYNDLGIYNFELFRYTEATFATTRLALFYLVFNGGFALAARLLRDKPLVRRDYVLANSEAGVGGFKLLTYAGIGLLAAYMAYTLWHNGVPALLGIDRLSYLRDASLLDRLLVRSGHLIAFVLGVTARKEKRFSLNGMILFALIVYAFLVGHKFSFVFELSVMYATPLFARWVINHPEWKPRLGKYAVRSVVIVAAFLGIAYSAYSSRLESVEGAQKLLVNRVMALQGEMWWAVDNDVMVSGHDRGHWEAELGRIVDQEHTPAETVGMRYLMIRILGGERAFPIFDNGYLYTMAYPAILIVTFPYLIALLLQFAAGALLLVLLYYLHWSLVYRHHIRAVIAFVMVLPYITMLMAGNLYVFFTLAMILKGAILLALECFPVRAHSSVIVGSERAVEQTS